MSPSERRESFKQNKYRTEALEAGSTKRDGGKFKALVSDKKSREIAISKTSSHPEFALQSERTSKTQRTKATRKSLPVAKSQQLARVNTVKRVSMFWQSITGKKDLDAAGQDGEEDCFQRPGKMMRRNREPAKRSRMMTRAQLRKIIDEAERYEEDGDDYFANAFDPNLEESDLSASADTPLQAFTAGGQGRKNQTQLRARPTPGAGSLLTAGHSIQASQNAASGHDQSEEETADDRQEASQKRPRCSRGCFYDHCRNSSLFIFHKEWKIRKFCLLLLIPVSEEEE